MFNQLFGEADPDQDVSPDTEDPEAAAKSDGDNNGGDAENQEGEARSDGNVERKSTRTWAEENDYNTQKIFRKLFCDDIKYLLTMENLWKNRQDRQPPSPLEWDDLPTSANVAQAANVTLADQKVWSVAECSKVLSEAINTLKEEAKKGYLEWDKDDLPALNFVTACANIRMFIFNIKQRSRFEVKSMAGNIIPAIATTNAVIAGCIVMEALKILNNQMDRCKTVYLR